MENNRHQEQNDRNFSFLSEKDRAEGYSISIDTLNNITLLKEGKEMAWFSTLSDMDITYELIKLIKADEDYKNQNLKLKDKVKEPFWRKIKKISHWRQSKGVF